MQALMVIVAPALIAVKLLIAKPVDPHVPVWHYHDDGVHGELS